jgi:hypothetical protein
MSFDINFLKLPFFGSVRAVHASISLMLNQSVNMNSRCSDTVNNQIPYLLKIVSLAPTCSNVIDE